MASPLRTDRRRGTLNEPEESDRAVAVAKLPATDTSTSEMGRSLRGSDDCTVTAPCSTIGGRVRHQISKIELAVKIRVKKAAIQTSSRWIEVIPLLFVASYDATVRGYASSPGCAGTNAGHLQ